MDSINNISAELKHPLVFSNYSSEPIVINNPTVEYRWKTVFITGVIGFVTFENIVNDEVFNFDIDFVRPLPDGSMMLVGKPIHITIALEHSIVDKYFERNMGRYAYEETLQRLLSDSDSDFLLAYNWMVLTMYQKQNGKKIGHETIWNLINYDDPKLIEHWDDLVRNASLQFVQHQGLIDDFMDEHSESDTPKDDIQQLLKQAKEHLMDEDNPLGKTLSEMLGTDKSFQEMMDDFANIGTEDFEDEEQLRQIEEIIEEHLDMLEISYQKEDGNTYYFLHESKRSYKYYECRILLGDEHLKTVTIYNRHIPTSDWPKILLLLNSLNSIINFGKLILNEENERIELRTEMTRPLTYLSEEPIIDMVDENWIIANESFNIFDFYLDGKMTFEEAIEEALDNFL